MPSVKRTRTGIAVEDEKLQVTTEFTLLPINGLLKGNGSSPVSLAVANVDYAAVSPTVDITNTNVVNAVPGTKYYATHAGLSTLLLPTTISKGAQILVRGSVGGTGLWRISQNAGQTIHGATNSTTGTGGYIASQAQYDTVALECIVANTDFVIIANRGTLTIV